MKASRTRRERAILGQVSDLDLRLLRVFKAVVDCGGMAAAELELNIGASTVSRNVKDLETRLGLRLCRRGRGGFASTPEGDRVYREILQLLGSVEAFRGSIDDIHRRMGGRLELAIFDKTATNTEARIHLAVAQFAALAPEVKLSVHVDSINGIERGLIGGAFHVGVMPVHRSSKTLSESASCGFPFAWSNDLGCASSRSCVAEAAERAFECEIGTGGDKTFHPAAHEHGGASVQDLGLASESPRYRTSASLKLAAASCSPISRADCWMCRSNTLNSARESGRTVTTETAPMAF
jgi:DNA-binding transcriptional LysR family regulator